MHVCRISGTNLIPVIISLSLVITTIAVLLIPDVGNANAWGKWPSSETAPTGALNIRINPPAEELVVAFPWWKRKGAPWPSGVFGCHLCCATHAAGAFISTIITESEVACIAEAGRLQRSGIGTAYGFNSFGFLKIVWNAQFQTKWSHQTAYDMTSFHKIY